ncbi:Uncharacterised protein [Candidatus Tiddalikarchaeum anstoanum]|nr:Uncharacterised protein [Candidatus Tiddalikarchaeum anstoanum]
MTKIPEANSRMFIGVFVCKNCKAKIRTDSRRIKLGAVKCRNCGCKIMRPKRVK